MHDLQPDFRSDLQKIDRIALVPLMLEAICRTTGLGFAAVARVTHTNWVAMSVRDEIQFGLLPGGELPLDTTLCHEIHQSGQGLVINDVSKDEFYCQHPTPAMYGFKSYISLPIQLQDGSFFGTLCAIDPSPAFINTPAIIGLFQTCAALIGFHLSASERLEAGHGHRLEAATREALQELLAGVGTGLPADADLRNDVIERCTLRLRQLQESLVDAV